MVRNPRQKMHVLSMSLEKKNLLSHPTPRPMGEGPQMYKYGGTVVKSMHLETGRSGVSILPLTNLFHRSQISPPLHQQNGNNSRQVQD